MTTDAKTTALETLEPTPVWRLFAGMTRIPRPSHHEDRIQEHMRSVAESRGLKVIRDDAGNLIVQVPATPGHEGAPVIVLQGHLDMVGDKNTATVHDFENDPIRAVVDKDANGEQIVRAEGTTLGADNGIGVCLALAAATEPDVVHGPLELLLTCNEEDGMTGAKAVTADLFKGRILINLDSEEDDALYIGCAGGSDTNLSWSLATSGVADAAEACTVTVAGLRGGHSGCDIHENRGNAIKLLAAVIAGDGSARIAEIQGGSKRNAIPREARCVVVGPSGIIEKLRSRAEQFNKETIRDAGEAKCSITVEKAPMPNAAVSVDDTHRILCCITALPQGVIAVVPEIPGLIQTSNNVSTMTATVAGGALAIKIGCLSRSASATQLDTLVRQVTATGRLAGATVDSGNEYPGWKPNVDSALLQTCRKVYERLFDKTPGVTAIHAGLECGIIGERVGEMDMISFGPRIEGPHSPDERVYVESVAKIWTMLKAVLTELA